MAACLLGRLYGLKARDALERVQSYHDSRASVKGLGCSTPSPSTVEQVSEVGVVVVHRKYDETGTRLLSALDYLLT